MVRVRTVETCHDAYPLHHRCPDPSYSLEVISVGGNDIALAPSIFTVLAMVLLTPGGVQKIGKANAQLSSSSLNLMSTG